jgi:hypothetical protein
MRKHITFAGALCLLVGVALATASCRPKEARTEPTPTRSATSSPVAGGDTSEVEAVAHAFAEIAGTFDYRDQKSQYDKLQPLLADKYPFKEDPQEIETQRIWTTRVLATRVVSISDDDAIVTVTTEDFRQYLSDQSSRVVEEHVLQQSDCRLVLKEGQWLVSASPILSEEPLPQEGGGIPSETPANAPTPSTKVLAVPTAQEEEIREAINELLSGIGHDPKLDVEVGGNTYYVDSSGTEWVGFTVFPIPASATDPAFGVAKRASGQSWILAFFGTGPIHDIPDDVAKGLGIEYRH